ncbi:phosphocholine cytidylyltransferase family protein [Henriciella aquimarina]|uniref:phosphocholine cytidylyltransferase family protein n=1 Tax=Henriciella aquimarina TaxID=545261 RepID=UPI0018F01277|nr:phosphocholine cytidylyltransferase family protein [Henriciella aquimarina]
MKAIILSAGRGSRLLPMTESKPKCLLEFCGRSVLGHQLTMLDRAGVDQATVVTGFMPQMVEEEVQGWDGRMAVSTLFNPFFQVADNLASCWMARGEMSDSFLLLNGDTLFNQALVEHVIQSNTYPVSVTIDRKSQYDEDDMKVTLDGERLKAIGKRLRAEETDAESIGLLKFTQEGAGLFRTKVEQMMRTQDGISAWFLKAIDALAKSPEAQVGTCSIEGHPWCELDTPEDWEHLKATGSAMLA